MAGIYIHIPFCKQKCTYCDFHKETNIAVIDEMVLAIIREMELRVHYLKGDLVSTIYFGGGTPSVLSRLHFRQIFNAISKLFNVTDDAEITIEANPDDLSEEYLEALASLPINRLSIGIQSFDDNDLKQVNRRHTVHQAKQAVVNARKAGFVNLSIDLIYGFPGQTPEAWQWQLQQALELSAEHISAYGLTYEEGTALWKQRNKGLIKEVNDEVSLQMYEYMLKLIRENGYEAYEISNFAKPGYRSRHNSAYWQFIPYLGVGPSAHSFDGLSRQWNISNNQLYMNRVKSGSGFFEIEHLTAKDHYNDYVMVALRTSEGINLDYLMQKFGKSTIDFCMSVSKKFIENDAMKLKQNFLCLTDTGKNISNLIIMELMKTD